LIVVCEPQCTGPSHEKVNSGFLTLVRRAYPGEPIRFYADRSHYTELQRMLAHDGVTVGGIEHREFAVRDAYTIGGIVAYRRQLARMLEEASTAGCHDVLFLSGSPMLLHLLKRLKARGKFARFRFTLVLHADFEDIANDEFAPVEVTAVAETSWLEKLRMIKPWELPKKVASLVSRRARARYARVFQERFRSREQLLWRRSPDFAYIALAPHVVTNAARYVDVDALQIRCVWMPINFAPTAPAPANEYLKVATFGIGEPATLRVVVDHLKALAPNRPYEIRIIGMDNRGLENEPNVYCPSPGKRLAREDMERHAADMDAFLILYPKTRYRLSCSGAILEALSYGKPVLHLGNPCIEPFDRPGAPIGHRCETPKELARLLAKMIDDYPAARAGFEQNRKNIVNLRAELSMENLAPMLRAAFLRAS
jgi:glycosyltransferase involved in cell wall biosynthesis